MPDITQSIISSVFSRRNTQGSLEETYVAHLKIWEDAGPEGRKARYILLSQATRSSGFIHKSKVNNNGSFSVGKTWRLAELRGLQTLSPTSFNITLSRTYRWQTESPLDQVSFLSTLIRLFRQITGGSSPLNLEGIEDPDSNQTAPAEPLRLQPQRAPRPQPSRNESDPAVATRIPSPLPRNNGIPIPRAASPANSTRDLSSSVRSRDSPLRGSAARPRVTSDVSLPPAQPLQPRRRPSNASQQVPTINLHPDTNGVSETNGRVRTDSQRSRNTNNISSEPEGTRSRKPSAARSQLHDTNGLTIPRKDTNTRVSFFDPGNQQTLDRLLSSGVSLGIEGEGDEVESAQDTLASVEEMIEGYEWASDDVIGRKMARGAADMIEARLLDELMALDKANIHSFLESDDRIGLVMKFMDDALAELDNLDGYISSYKIHLNAVNDDISHIQSQNRGLQVQTQNQRALLAELENLLQTVQVDSNTLTTLTQESLEKSPSITKLEHAAAELYKALQAGRDTDMAATMERLQEYRTHNAQFCKRMYDFLSIMFSAQGKLLLGESSGLTKVGKGKKQKPTIVLHGDLEEYLGRYCGLMLYLKEMDEGIYGRLCAAYFSAASELHSTQIKALFTAYLGYVKKAGDEEGDQGFASTPTQSGSKGASGMRRAGTLIRSPIESRNREKEKSSSTTSESNLRVSEVFALIVEQLIPLICQENEFIVDFLQIQNSDASVTFADYMGLDNYFRRQAARSNSLSQATVKLIRGAMELVFGFLPAEVKSWLDKALEKDAIEIVGVLATLEKFMLEVEDKGNQFLIGLLGKQHTRLKGVFDRHINDQLKAIEQTKLTSKKRKGIAPFIKQFPPYMSRVENQLQSVNADGLGLEVRSSVSGAYEKIVNKMFESLKLMAKMDGEEEDKGQMNFNVILIENMHYFVSETSKMETASVRRFTMKARDVYDENLSAYVKILFRRPFGKIIDYFEGLERLLRTLAAPTDITNNPTYSKSALRKITREYTNKDIRKYIEVMYKRVEKHFIEASTSTPSLNSTPGSEKDKDKEKEIDEVVGRTVLLGVWRTCEEELIKLMEGWKERISQCYGEGVGNGLDFSVADVESSFRRLRG